MHNNRRNEWLQIIGLLSVIPAIAGLVSLYKGESFFGGFFKAYGGFAIAVGVLFAHVGLFALIGYLIAKPRSEAKQWAAGGAVVGWFVFLFFGQIWFK